jgi:hypothetical protein
MRFEAAWWVLPMLLGCGTATPAGDDGGSPDSGTSVHDASGSPDSEMGNDASPSLDGGDASMSDSGTCAQTPDEVACADAGECPTATEYCCGDVSVGSGACNAKGVACLAGSIVAASCDDTSDCPSGQICCAAPPVQQPGPWLTQCQVPATGPSPPCGSNSGHIAYDHLCSCDTECGGGASCSTANAAFVYGRRACLTGG